MAVKLVKYFRWPAVDRPGEILRFARGFERAGLNLEALWAYKSPAGEATIAAIGRNPAKLRAVLKKMGINPRISGCFYLTGEDKAGALVDKLTALVEAGVNVDCMDGLAVGSKYAAAIWVDDADVTRAKRALKIR